jgi:DNA primase
MIAQALGVPIVETVAKYVKLARKGRVFWGCCPFHKDKTPSFKVENERQSFRCFGCDKGGDVIDFLRAIEKLSFAEAVERLVGSSDVHAASAPERRREKAPSPPPEPDPSPRALRVWLAAKPITGTLGELYLRQHRGVTIPLPDATLRFGRVWHHEERADFPAVVAAIATPFRKIIAVQCTFLTEDGCKAPIEHPRLTIGALGTGAIRLAPTKGELGLAEGFEKALAAFQLSGVPCWSSVGASRLHKITVPASVHTVHIFGDNNDAGRQAAERAKAEYRKASRKVVVRFPPPAFEDYDAITQAQARAVTA